MSGKLGRTLVFCTAWSPDEPGHTRRWDGRYRRWLEAIKRSKLDHDCVLIVDDGSRSLPAWDDVTVVRQGQRFPQDSGEILYSFESRLGRLDISNFPGWVRSFGFAALFAEQFGYDKVVHIESDAFVISERMQHYINDVSEGWVAFWCPLWERPESGIQVIAGSSVKAFCEIARQPIERLATSVIENTLPFTHVERGFIGDRYGERQNGVPMDADFSMQTFPGIWSPSSSFFWWIPSSLESADADAKDVMKQYQIEPGAPLRHDGLNYLAVFEKLSAWLAPRSYFEIGSKNGHSMSKFHCDTICVDPNLQLDLNVIGRKTRTFLFQMPSDDFFASEPMRRYLAEGPDIGFLDGLHLAEFLLRDFMNFEKVSHPKSIAILHDCLPFNLRMAERELRRGGDDEPEADREYWTGDVWKVLVALQRFRPDLRVFCLDCPPTGLVVITGLDSSNRALDLAYDDIIREFSTLDLETFTADRVWRLFPLLSSAALFQNAVDLKVALGLDGTA